MNGSTMAKSLPVAQKMAIGAAKIFVKCEGNNSPKYDGKIWEEEVKYIVEVNGQSIDPCSQQDIKPGDRVIIRRPGKGGRRVRNWQGIVMSDSDVEEASRKSVKQPSSTRKRKGHSEHESSSNKKPKGTQGTYVRITIAVVLQYSIVFGLYSEYHKIFIWAYKL